LRSIGVVPVDDDRPPGLERRDDGGLAFLSVAQLVLRDAEEAGCLQGGGGSRLARTGDADEDDDSLRRGLRGGERRL